MSSEDWNAVLDYWFGGGDPKKRPKWFGGGEPAAEEIRQKFGPLVEKARNNELKHWEEDPKGTFALILLQDQFCRSLYSGTPKAHDRDPYCLELAKKFLERKTHDHLKFSPAGRFFLYLPFEHAEDREVQALAVKLFTQLKEDVKGTEEEQSGEFWLSFAVRHKYVVDLFGRFPQRNKSLGREDTPEEAAWLANPPAEYIF